MILSTTKHLVWLQENPFPLANKLYALGELWHSLLMLDPAGILRIPVTTSKITFVFVEREQLSFWHLLPMCGVALSTWDYPPPHPKLSFPQISPPPLWKRSMILCWSSSTWAKGSSRRFYMMQTGSTVRWAPSNCAAKQMLPVWTLWCGLWRMSRVSPNLLPCILWSLGLPRNPPMCFPKWLLEYLAQAFAVLFCNVRQWTWEEGEAQGHQTCTFSLVFFNGSLDFALERWRFITGG